MSACAVLRSPSSCRNLGEHGIGFVAGGDLAAIALANVAESTLPHLDCSLCLRRNPGERGVGAVAPCDTASALADMLHDHCMIETAPPACRRNPGERGVGFVALADTADTASAIAEVGCTRGTKAVLWK